MKNIIIADATLCKKDSRFAFKEKIEIARQLENLNVDVIELPEIENAKADILLVKTISSFIKNSVISVAAGIGADSVKNAILALSTAKKPCVRIELPCSPVGMEYSCRKKPEKMLEYIKECVSTAKNAGVMVEFCALDATRAEEDFLRAAIEVATESGATTIAICDTAANMLPDDFATFASKITSYTTANVAVMCNNNNGLAVAQASLAVKNGISTVKTAVDGETVDLEIFAKMVKNCGFDYGFSTKIKTTELSRIIKQIRWINNKAESTVTSSTSTNEVDGIHLDKNDDQTAVIMAAKKLGYDLSEDDQTKVYEEFLRVASKKNVGYRELEAIIASVALQVPAAYKLISYVINNGNIITSSAQITLEKDGKAISGVNIGDGPIDAAFRAIDQIIGHHYELDDFQIQSVTEGKEAMGSALVKLRSSGKLYSGNGISTDIMGASIRAYINAVNKIIYEETN